MQTSYDDQKVIRLKVNTLPVNFEVNAESPVPPDDLDNARLIEDGSFRLLEDNSFRLLE